MPATSPSNTELLSAGLTALLDGSWADAHAAFAQALADEESAEALEGFAAASWWLDDVDAAIEARERAYALRRAADQTAEAAMVAALLAWDHGAMRGANAVANGWLQRARRLVSDLPPSGEHAWLSLIEASFHLDTDAEAVLRLSTEAAELARAHGGHDAEMTAWTLQGLALVSLGRVEEGTRLLDEGTAAVTGGELHDPIAIGSCCCNMIIACERVRDFDRAGQWCERLAAFCERSGQRPLLALCRAHLGTVLTMRGEWGPAEDELAWATGELATLRPPLAGYARARFADLRRRQGRTQDARALLAEADGHVLVGLVRSALALDEDDPSSAVGHLEKYLRVFGDDRPVESAPAFELLVPARLRLGELDGARDAHERLAAVADAVGTESLKAAERAAAGAIAVAERVPVRARSALEDAIDLFERCRSPFEAAQARIDLARVLAADDRVDLALELARASCAVFEGLGATGAARLADALVAELGGPPATARRAGLTQREVEVLALVAQGLSNREAADRLFVSEHTVHRHLSNVYTRLGVSSRAAAVAVAAERGLLA